MRFRFVRADRDAQHVGCDIHWRISRQWRDDRWASSSCHYHAPLHATAQVEDLFPAFTWPWSCLDELASAEQPGLDQAWFLRIPVGMGKRGTLDLTLNGRLFEGVESAVGFQSGVLTEQNKNLLVFHFLGQLVFEYSR